MSELLADEPSNPLIVSSEIVFKGKVWDIRSEVFDYDNQELTREFTDHSGAVAVLAIDDHGRALLIQQYRHPIRMRDWEIPAGLLDVDNEDPLDAAKRELEEEVDLVASEWTDIVDFYSSPGGSNELIRVYLATGLSASSKPFERVDEEAHIVKRWVALDEIVAAVLDGRLKNSILAIAVLAAHARG
ncbi:MAG: hydrolase [Glaciihabitans sp.]|jgi:ADP-ribose pyrophosphatase|nr:hydrolase [Glaciihabitans sp.]